MSKHVADYRRTDWRTGREQTVSGYQRPASTMQAVADPAMDTPGGVATADPFEQPAARDVNFDELFGFSGRDLLADGQPVRVTGWRAQHVHGQSNRLRPEHVSDAGDSIFGPGLYLAADEQGAEEYGDDVVAVQVTLANPKVVDVAAEDVPMDNGQPDFEAVAQDLAWEAEHAQAQGHDSIVVSYPETVADEWGGEDTLRREIFVFADRT